MASGYPAVDQWAPQMVSSLRATVEPGAHMEASGVDPKSWDDEDSDLDYRDYQAGQPNQESRTKFVVHAFRDNSPDCQTLGLKPSLDFFFVNLSLRVEPKWMLGLSVTIMGRSLLSIQMVLRNQRPTLTPWNQLLLVLPFLEKRFFHKQMTWWMIPPPSPYLMKAWMAQMSRKRRRLHLRGWTEGFLNLHQKGNVKLN